jgi:hypothetical protein
MGKKVSQRRLARPYPCHPNRIRWKTEARQVQVYSSTIGQSAQNFPKRIGNENAQLDGKPSDGDNRLLVALQLCVEPTILLETIE